MQEVNADSAQGSTAASSSSSTSLIQKIKRTVTQRRSSLSLPNFLTTSSTNHSNTTSRNGNSNSVSDDEQDTSLKAYTIAPPSHRENTPIHALMDTLPSLPTFPSFPTKYLRSSTSAPSNDVNGSAVEPLANGGNNTTNAPTRRGSTSDKLTRTYKGDPFSTLSGNFVTLGGYRGSVLRDKKTHRRLWIPIKTGLTIRKVDLSIGLTDEDEERTAETIIASTQVMQIVGVLDLGKRLKDKIKSLEAKTTAEATASTGTAFDARLNPTASSRPAPVHFVNHGYDWRRRLELSSAELIERLERLKRESKARGEGPDGQGEGATVIAHSMGGLVLLHALATCKDPTIFKGIIFAGVPFNGTPNILSPFRYGDRLLLNRDVCSPSAVFSMRSSFYFLPRSGLCFETPAGEPIPVDFYDPHSWSRYNLSPMAANLYNDLEDAEQDHDNDTQSRGITREQWKQQAEHADGPIGTGVDVNMGERTLDPPSLSLSTGSEDLSPPADESKTPSRLKRMPTLEAVSPVDARQNLPSLAGDDEVQFGPSTSSNRDATTQRDRTNSASSSSSSSEPESDEQQQREGTDLEGNERIKRNPSFSELSKVLSSSDHVVSTYLRATLERVQKFYSDIDTSYDATKPYPPIVLLTSRKTPTVRGCIMPSRSSIASTQYTDLLFDEGDGIVLYSSASSLPSGPDKWNKHVKGVVESNFGHVSLIGDLGAIRQCLHLLYG
ncbi:hypothetical protein OIO90_004400 [Microbotryomycetes sp. JL221]|nr:hypothetical protein OIO90_004400 [Microbotryomycetes sp. JL221]